MKTALILVTLTLKCIIVNAEYMAFQIKFVIEDFSGNKSIGYKQTLPFDDLRDSMYNDVFVLDFLKKLSGETDTLTYCMTRIEYPYPVEGKDPYPLFYQIKEETKNSFAQIKSIHITEVVEFSYLCWLFNDVKESDTTWFKDSLVSKISLEGYLCSYELMIHEDSKEVMTFLEELRANYLEKAATYDWAEMEMRELEELDAFLFEIAHQIEDKGFKVIIVSCCTC